MLQLFALQARTWVNYAIDAGLLLVIVLFALSTAKKGFIECFFRFVKVIGAILVAILLSKMFIGLLDDWFNITTKFTGFFEKSLLKVNGFETAISNADIRAMLEGKSFPAFLIDLILDAVGNSSLPEGTTLALVAGQTLSKLCVSAIAFIVLFVGALLVMNLLKKFLKLLASKIALLGVVDQLLGAAVGFIEALLVISLALSALSFIPTLNISGYINDCMLAGWLYNNNVLSIIFGWIAG